MKVPNRGSSGRRALIGLAGLGASLIVLELLTRLALVAFGGDRFSPGAIASQRARRAQEIPEPERALMDAARMIVVHPYLGYVYNPEQNSPTLTEHHRGLPITRHGLLDRASPLRPASPDTIVVGVFGGSVAYFLSVEGLEALRGALSAAPPFRDREISLVRVALGGYKQPQQLLAAAYLLSLGAHFDVLVNLDGFNEIALPATENVPHDVAAFFPSQWHVQFDRLPDREAQLSLGRIALLREQRRGWADWFESSVLRHSAVAGALWRIRDARLARRLTGEMAALRLRRRSGTPGWPAKGPARSYGSARTMYEHLAQIWQNGSLQLHRLCESNGIEYFHFLQPNQYAGPKPMGPDERQTALNDDSPYRESVEVGYPLLRAAGAELAAEGVRFRDLTDLFATVNEPVYRDDCCHLNRAGNAILGEAIGRAIVAALSGATSGTP